MFTVRLLRFKPRFERQRCDRALGDCLTFPLPVAPIDVAPNDRRERQKRGDDATRERPHDFHFVRGHAVDDLLQSNRASSHDDDDDLLFGSKRFVKGKNDFWVGVERPYLLSFETLKDSRV